MRQRVPTSAFVDANGGLADYPGISLERRV